MAVIYSPVYHLWAYSFAEIHSINLRASANFSSLSAHPSTTTINLYLKRIARLSPPLLLLPVLPPAPSSTHNSLFVFCTSICRSPIYPLLSTYLTPTEWYLVSTTCRNRGI